MADKTTHEGVATFAPDKWFYPKEVAHDLDGLGLSDEVVAEVLTCGWEYARCIIPHFTNWDRYIAFTRIVIIGTLAEFKGDLVRVDINDSKMLNYDLDEIFSVLFAGHPHRIEMQQEFRAFLLITADKCCGRRESELFRRWANAIAVLGPSGWFRIRDCDGLLRFTIGSALACSDIDGFWFTEAELRIFAEIGIARYDAVAYYKHRAEGEISSTFAYASASSREAVYSRCREVLWALEVLFAQQPAYHCAFNFLQPFGGPIHMMMRRYRFVEDGLMVGRPETQQVVEETRENFKLWARLDVEGVVVKDTERFESLLERKDRLFFPGLAEMLEASDEGSCSQCEYRRAYGVTQTGQFGGVQLCEGCRAVWNEYMQTLPARAASVFPGLSEFIQQQG